MLSELGALAGWEALDQYDIGRSWEHHQLAKQAAHEADGPGLLAHTVAQQAFVLSELGEIRSAVEQLSEARTLVKRTAPRLRRACSGHGWLRTGKGWLSPVAETRRGVRSTRPAHCCRPTPWDPTLPFLFLESVHLDRWRGHALARLGDVEAVGVLQVRLNGSIPRYPCRDVASSGSRGCAGRDGRTWRSACSRRPGRTVGRRDRLCQAATPYACTGAFLVLLPGVTSVVVSA